DLFEYVLDRKHALWAAEATESGVGGRVGLAPIRGEREIFEEVAVVYVEHGPIVDRPGKISREAAARREHELEPGDAALAVEADVVVVPERVSLPGLDHVVVAVDAHLHGPPRPVREDRGDTGVKTGLR